MHLAEEDAEVVLLGYMDGPKMSPVLLQVAHLTCVQAVLARRPPRPRLRSTLAWVSLANAGPQFHTHARGSATLCAASCMTAHLRTLAGPHHTHVFVVYEEITHLRPAMDLVHDCWTNQQPELTRPGSHAANSSIYSLSAGMAA
jgi:hypothetical protein